MRLRRKHRLMREVAVKSLVLAEVELLQVFATERILEKLLAAFGAHVEPQRFVHVAADLIVCRIFRVLEDAVRISCRWSRSFSSSSTADGSSPHRLPF